MSFSADDASKPITVAHVTDLIAFPALRAGQELVWYQCTSTPHKQERGHIGVHGPPIHSLQTCDEDAVVEFVHTHRNNPFLEVYAKIAVTRESPERRCISIKYWTLLIRDFV